MDKRHFSPKEVVETWSDRLTDKNNLWLDAVNTEDDGNLLKATILYLKDASNCWQCGLLVRAALSCSCAANCLSKTSNWKYAIVLYREAARIYEKNAYLMLDKSIRESLWSLQRAYENFILASDNNSAEDIFQKYASLAAKTSPFFGKEESMRMLGFAKLVVASSSKTTTDNRTIVDAQPSKSLFFSSSFGISSEEIRRSIDRFLETSGSDLNCEDAVSISYEDNNNNHNYSSSAISKGESGSFVNGNDSPLNSASKKSPDHS